MKNFEINFFYKYINKNITLRPYLVYFRYAKWILSLVIKIILVYETAN